VVGIDPCSPFENVFYLKTSEAHLDIFKRRVPSIDPNKIVKRPVLIKNNKYLLQTMQIYLV